MKIINQSWNFIDEIDGLEILKKLERIGRVSYKSEDKITEDSAAKFVKMLINSGHESVIEHVSLTAYIITDRGVSHELVRHRIASFTQESTRFCNYSKGKFGSELTFIQPVDFILDEFDYNELDFIEEHYTKYIKNGSSPQQARYFLPNGLKTELYMTMNLREWRHFFKLRTSPKAHPQMRALALGMLSNLRHMIPVIFEDIN